MRQIVANGLHQIQPLPSANLPNNGHLSAQGSKTDQQPFAHTVTKMESKDEATSILLNAYKDKIQDKDLFCLNELEQEWSEKKPFSGMKVLMNVHMTLITLTMIRMLIRAGAEVEATASDYLVTHANAVEPLLAAKIKFYPNGNVPKEKETDYYDVVFDCGAGMLNKIRPTKGMVELTRTDPKIYEDISFPVITVDNSSTKEIETRYGTGDGLVRVLTEQVSKSLMCLPSALIVFSAQPVNYSQPQALDFLKYQTLLAIIRPESIFDKKYMIFGYGKVGKGIALGLLSAGVPENHICIVDTSYKVTVEIDRKYQVFLLDTNDSTSVASVKDAIVKERIFAVITATGVENAISKFFTPKDFETVPYRINMGTPDEFGAQFTTEMVFNAKKPANFSLDFPTSVMYLDPIFKLYLKAGENLLVPQHTQQRGLQDVDKAIDTSVIRKWHTHHKENVWSHKAALENAKQLLLTITLNLLSPVGMQPLVDNARRRFEKRDEEKSPQKENQRNGIITSPRLQVHVNHHSSKHRRKHLQKRHRQLTTVTFPFAGNKSPTNSKSHDTAAAGSSTAPSLTNRAE